MKVVWIVGMLLSLAPLVRPDVRSNSANLASQRYPEREARDGNSGLANGGSKKHRTRGIRWWNLAHTKGLRTDDLLNPESPLYISPNLQPLTRKQRRLVTKNPGTIVAIAKGARIAVDECQRQFRDRRWNCPISDGSEHGGSVFGKILRKGCRETAFIYAMTSASLAYSIARACSEGSVYTCSCGRGLDNPVPAHQGREWEWGGCSDNAQFGHKFSRDFIDRVEKEGRDLRCTMNLHNNEAGRMHVSKDMRQDCKCHGMSGSCTIKTCWMRLPGFHNIGNGLKDKFDGASKVIQDNSGKNRRVGLMPVDANHKPPSDGDLVYYETSPNFCERDSSIGYKGTRGRECNASSIGVDGCDLLCCGRGSRTETYTAKERCNCIFHWCCQVTCDTCTREKVRHICL